MFDKLRKNQDSLFNVKPYQAVELVGIGAWINTDTELSLSKLKGQVVLIDFWAFGYINCVRTLPHTQNWYEKYKDKGFIVIGVHTPEFDSEKVLENLSQHVQLRGLTFPVVQDNDFDTWNAYSNKYWPAHYLIDKQGQVRRVHFGEGKYEEMDKAIRLLIQE